MSGTRTGRPDAKLVSRPAAVVLLTLTVGANRSQVAGRTVSGGQPSAATRSVGGEHAERLARLWAAFVDVNAVTGNMAGVRAAVEELHAKFAPPVAVAPVASGTPTAARHGRPVKDCGNFFEL
jgi:hypothetical protein